MKSVLVLVLAVCAIAFAYPRAAREESKEDDSSDTELFSVPLEHAPPRRPVFGFSLSDDLAPPPFEQHPFFSSQPWGDAPQAGGHVDDFMTQMQEMLKEMRRQLTELLHRSHPAGGLPDNSSVGTSIGEDELPQNKSTSTTKVIDGHVVTVNETTYSSGDDNIGAVFRIKVVEVKPTEEAEAEGDVEEGAEVMPTAANPEPTTSKSELEEDHHEETNEIPNQKVPYEWSAELDPSLNEIEEMEVEEMPELKKENYYDLSSDTKVNEFLADQPESQRLIVIDPDAELIDSNNNMYYQYNTPTQRLQIIYP